MGIKSWGDFSKNQKSAKKHEKPRKKKTSDTSKSIISFIIHAFIGFVVIISLYYLITTLLPVDFGQIISELSSSWIVWMPFLWLLIWYFFLRRPKQD